MTDNHIILIIIFEPLCNELLKTFLKVSIFLSPPKLNTQDIHMHICVEGWKHIWTVFISVIWWIQFITFIYIMDCDWLILFSWHNIIVDNTIGKEHQQSQSVCVLQKGRGNNECVRQREWDSLPVISRVTLSKIFIEWSVC